MIWEMDFLRLKAKSWTKKECLSELSLSLESPFLYSNRPMKFAQGSGILEFSLPLPARPRNASNPKGAPLPPLLFPSLAPEYMPAPRSPSQVDAAATRNPMKSPTITYPSPSLSSNENDKENGGQLFTKDLMAMFLKYIKWFQGILEEKSNLVLCKIGPFFARSQCDGQ
jgi:hypothetical protein